MNEPSVPPPLNSDPKTLLFLISVIAAGGLSAFASLMASETVLTPRVITAYLLSGLVASGVVVAMLVEEYGLSWFLIGVSILAGYKATDLLAMASSGIKTLIQKKFHHANSQQ